MHILEGVIVAMLTPFDDKGRIAEKEVVKMVNFLIEKEVDGIFPVSSCCEYVHLDMDERKYLIDIVMDAAIGRVDIIPGTGTTCYQKSIEILRKLYVEVTNNVDNVKDTGSRIINLKFTLI
ncbi:MAG: dihydrodipicolinate synthase family protein [Candidatus Humimicrobiaceae bacterium]